MKCSKCHAELDPNDNFCGECGQAVSGEIGREEQSVEPDSGNIAFVKISELFEYAETRPVRPLFWGYILSAHLNLKMTTENIIEIIYPGNYLEYIHVNYEDGIASAMSMFYSNMSVSADELSQNLRIDSDSANLIACQYPDTENQIAPENLITGYLNGDIQDCMILSCLPFSIELENQLTGGWDTIVDQFTTIPWETPVFIERATDRLACKFRSQNMEIIKVAPLAEPIENTELRFLIDTGYVKYFELPSGRKVYL